MKALNAFIKKEMLEQLRSGKLIILIILFVLFGIMNPAMAKLTPWLFEMLEESLAQSGMSVTEVTVTAMDSWVQFYKNVPMALIAFVLLEGGVFTKEYESGTLVMSLTKGLERYKVIVSKTAVLVALWMAGYWACFGITYGYNAYFWDNSIAENLMFSAVCWWLFGLWVIMLMVLISVIGSSNTAVLAGTGGIVFISYLLGLVPKIKEYLPTQLMDGNSLIYAAEEPEAYTAAIIITAALCLVCFVLSIPVFNKKQL